MRRLGSRLALPRGVSRRVPVFSIMAMLAGTSFVGLMTVKQPFAARLIAGLAAVAAYVVVAIQSRDLALLLAVIWLTFLGFVRRALIPFVGWPQFDPLLLLGPICAIVLWVTARGKRSRPTAMSMLVVILFGLAIAQVLNPQSHTGDAILGLLFWVGPLLWFFVGRTLTENQVRAVLRWVSILVIPVAIHGLRQSYGHLLPFEYTWVGVSGGLGGAIFVNGFKIRPFSTLTSPQEYAFYLSFAALALWTRILAEPRGRLWKTAAFSIAVWALFLAAVRTAFVLFLLALMITLILRARLAGTRLLMSGVVLLLIALAAMRATAPTNPATPADAELPGTSSSALAQHQITGLTQPESSTLSLHRELVKDAFSKALANPLGIGLGTETLAASKRMGAPSVSAAENDLASTFVVLGLLGGIVYSAFLLISLSRALKFARRRPTATAIAVAGITVALVTQWYTGQLYTVSSYLWLLLGFLGRPRDSESDHRSPGQDRPDERHAPIPLEAAS